jgi:hypothetical protein
MWQQQQRCGCQMRPPLPLLLLLLLLALLAGLQHVPQLHSPLA